MTYRSIVPTRTLSAWTLLTLSALWIAGAASPAPGQETEPAPGQETEPAAVPEIEVGRTEAKLTALAEDLDAQEWPLVDEKTGLPYRIEKLPKREGAYRWIDDDHVQMPLGVQFEVVEHDEEWLYVKYLKPQIDLPVRRKKVGPTPEELEKAAAAYRFELAAADRLRFEEFGHGLPRHGQWRNGFDVADMNGDGHLDVVFGPARKGRAQPNVFLGDSRGNWRLWEATYPPLPYDYGDVEAADFNGDGHMDLAFGIHLRGMLVLVSDGGSGFLPWSEGIALGHPGQGGDDSAFSSRAIASIDWNRDGRLDLIALGEGPKGTSRRRGAPTQIVDTSRDYLVYLNQGDGTWAARRPLEATGMVRPNFGDGFVIADFDGDQRLDLVSVSRQMGNNQILRRGAEGGALTVEAMAEVRPKGLVTAVAVADLDGDGHGDLVLAYTNRELNVWRSGIDVLYGAPELAWKRRPLFNEETRRGITALAVGELDGDGHRDLAALTGDGEVRLFLGDGHGFFVRETEELTATEAGCEGFGLRLVDLDADGRDEMIASFAGEPTGFPGIPGLSAPGCSGQGSLRAWKPRPAS
jgi:hypothetical protein